MLSKVKSRLFSGKKYIIMVLIFVLTIIQSNCGRKNGEANPELYFSKSEYSTFVGNYVIITLKVADVENLFACSMLIEYFTSIVEYSDGSLTSGNFWSGNLVEMSKEDGVGLSLCVGLKQSTGSDGITGSGDLFSFQLKGKSINETALEINNVNLIDEDGNYIKNFDDLEITNSIVAVN